MLLCLYYTQNLRAAKCAGHSMRSRDNSNFFCNFALKNVSLNSGSNFSSVRGGWLATSKFCSYKSNIPNRFGISKKSSLMSPCRCQVLRWSPNSQWDGVRRWGLWGVTGDIWGQEGGDSWGICALMKGHVRELALSPSVSTQWEAVCKLGNEPSPEPSCVGILISDFKPPEL